MSFVKELGRSLIKLRISSCFKIKQPDFLLRFYPTKISLVLWCSSAKKQEAYPVESEFFRSYLKKDDVVIDVGANIGFLTLISSVSVGPEGTVYAIEAHPKIFQYLKGNIKVNNFRNIIPYNFAIGNSKGHIYFSDKQRDDENQIIQNNNGIQIPMVPLDSLSINHDSIALLKIDVEGYEKFVLEGAGQILSKTQTIFMESYETHFREYGYSLTDIAKILRCHNFSLYKLQNKTAIPVPETYTSPSCENLIAIKSPADFQERTGINIQIDNT